MIAPGSLAVETCPECGGRLRSTGWHMPGMRMLARARCAACGRDVFVDLPAGQGLYSPMVLDAATGVVHDREGVPWFADWLRSSYRDRVAETPGFTVERHRPITRPVVLLNCLDTLYGHALLKLLNAQQYLDTGAVDVVAIVQPFLVGLVPDGVAETWRVDLSLSEGKAWSEGLADAIAAECVRFGDFRIAPVHPHPHPSLFSIDRFSRTRPFDLSRWHSNAAKAVTFVWREDRAWRPRGRLIPLGQATAVAAFFEALRAAQPGLDAAVAGIGNPGGLPGWIADLRSPKPSESVDRSWLARYARSHAVVGIHGSNLILPSAHAGSVFELLPEDREGNFLQDMVFNGSDPRDLFFRYRFLAEDIAPDRLAWRVAFVLDRYPDFDRLMALDPSRDRDVRA